MLINRVPRPELVSSAFYNDFIQIVDIAGACLLSPQITRNLRAKLDDPTTESLIGDVHCALKQHFPNFTQQILNRR